jgi:hypothetical protein
MNATLISRKALKIRGTRIGTFEAGQPLGLGSRLDCDLELPLTLFIRQTTSRLRRAWNSWSDQRLNEKGALLGPTENLVGSSGRERSDRQGDRSTPRVALKAWPEEGYEAPTSGGSAERWDHAGGQTTPVASDEEALGGTQEKEILAVLENRLQFGRSLIVESSHSLVRGPLRLPIAVSRTCLRFAHLLGFTIHEIVRI